MKNLKQSLLILVIGLVLGCQESNTQTPQAVKDTFQKMYPGENNPDWEVDDHGNYESHFKNDGISYRADFSPNGDWIETENSIDEDDLPEAVLKVIENDYDSDEITEIEKVDHFEKGTFYDVEFKQKGKNKDVEIAPDGTILNL